MLSNYFGVKYYISSLTFGEKEMSIPAGIPAGFLAHCNYTTKKPVQYDHKNYINTLPVPDQAFVNPTGVVMENQFIALNSGPRSYFEHTLNGTTVEKTLLT